MQPGAGDSTGSDVDAVLDILSRPDDDDLADMVELVAKICAAEAAGITVRKGERLPRPDHLRDRAVRLPRRRHLLPAHHGCRGRVHRRGRPRRSALPRHRVGRRHAGAGPLLRLGTAVRPRRHDGRTAVRHRPGGTHADPAPATLPGDDRRRRDPADRAPAAARRPGSPHHSGVRPDRGHGRFPARCRAQPRPAGPAELDHRRAWRCWPRSSANRPPRSSRRC